MSSEREPPTTPEVEEQLRRMLTAKRFRNARNQSAFLELVVNRALQKKKTSGRIIAKALFGQTFLVDESTDVRVTASNLRGSLKKYFDAEGCDDPVRIFLPEPSEDKSVRLAKGEAYTPVFTYHPFQTVSFQVRMADALVSQDALASLKQAIHEFSEVLELAPEHIGAAIGMVEAWCCLIFWLRNCGEPLDIESASHNAAMQLERVQTRAAKHWKFHAVFGFLYTAMDELALAKAPFAEALRLSRSNTESYPPYLQYLIRAGGKDRGLRLADRYLEERMDDTNAYVAFADIMFYAGKSDEADKVLVAAIHLRRDNGLVHHRLFLLRLVQRRFDDAIAHFEHMTRLLDPLSCHAAVGYARKLIEEWPEEDRAAFEERHDHALRREKAISRALKSVKA